MKYKKQFTFNKALIVLGVSFLFLVITYFSQKGKSGGDIAFIFFNAVFQILFNLLILFGLINKDNLIKISAFILLNVILISVTILIIIT